MKIPFIHTLWAMFQHLTFNRTYITNIARGCPLYLYPYCPYIISLYQQTMAYIQSAVVLLFIFFEFQFIYDLTSILVGN